ncbi:hypothetical protein GDO78_004571 [Eleutherodactylus coqui]|uniref:Uncharacterized protein n=1 Tax=Eleutherodactylus coqui TaxID=57060 RepID=A0A8J6ESJ6_ELECQ|nr:hypothetical protein GDO78_004571 [Eleutherodactylus coqui]
MFVVSFTLNIQWPLRDQNSMFISVQGHHEIACSLHQDYPEDPRSSIPYCLAGYALMFCKTQKKTWI